MKLSRSQGLGFRPAVRDFATPNLVLWKKICPTSIHLIMVLYHWCVPLCSVFIFFVTLRLDGKNAEICGASKHTLNSFFMIKFKTVSIFIFFAFFSFPVFSQVDTLALIDKAYAAGTKMVNHFHQKEYSEFVDFTHPAIVNMLGGKEQMMDLIAKGIGPDMEFIGVSLEKPARLLFKDSTVQCAMEQRQEIKMGGEKFYTLGTLIGISYNAGEDWVYIAAAKIPFAQLLESFPELSEELEVKVQTDPVRF